jgi:hypothetical protein
MHRELLIHFKENSAKQNFVRRIAQNRRLGRKNAVRSRKMNKYESAKEELYNALWILCGEQDDVYEQVCMGNYPELIMEEIHKLAIKLSDMAQ